MFRAEPIRAKKMFGRVGSVFLTRERINNGKAI